MKAFKWILIPALIAGVVAAVGVGLFLRQVNRAKKELADFILANPAATAVAAYTFDENGDLVDDGQALFHNADQPLILASTMKLVVLATYAETAAAGDLDPHERIPVAEWEQYYLPLTDGGAHALGLQSVGLKADEAGFAVDQTATVTLDDLARMMMHFSGNAATDYLITRLGNERLARMMETADLPYHTPIHPTLGPALIMFNYEEAHPSLAQLETILAEANSGNQTPMAALIDRYLHDPAWRSAQIAYMQSDAVRTRLGEAEMWVYQTTANQLFPQATAREYAQLMANIANGRFISADVSAIMQTHLESVPSDWPLRLLYFDRFGAKDGVTAGVLTLASYAQPKRGALAGQNRVVVVLLNEMPPDLWQRQLPWQGHYLLQTDLAQASGAFQELHTLHAFESGD